MQRKFVVHTKIFQESEVIWVKISGKPLAFSVDACYNQVYLQGELGMKAKLNITLRIISNALLVLILILTLLLVGVRLFGIEILTVLSPSMEPQYPTGSLIYLIDVDPATLEVEDVITYKISSTSTATHRIKEIIPDQDDPSVVRFRTKGDNNDTYDGKLVEFEQVQGKVVFCIPFLGYLAMYIQSPPGLYVAIGAALAIILFVMIVDTVTDEKKDKNKQKGEPENEKI